MINLAGGCPHFAKGCSLGDYVVRPTKLGNLSPWWLGVGVSVTSESRSSDVNHHSPMCSCPGTKGSAQHAVLVTPLILPVIFGARVIPTNHLLERKKK